jgi:Predicted metal binding domain
MDATVSKRKFDRAVEDLGTRAADFVTTSKWEIVEAVYPLLAVTFTHPRSGRRVGFRFQCDDWDALPPSLSLFDPEKGDELGWDKWPKNGWAGGEAHPVTRKPFLCLPGIREYHTHSSHLKEIWDNFKGRESYTLPYILCRVQQKFGDTND